MIRFSATITMFMRRAWGLAYLQYYLFIFCYNNIWKSINRLCLATNLTGLLQSYMEKWGILSWRLYFTRLPTTLIPRLLNSHYKSFILYSNSKFQLLQIFYHHYCHHPGYANNEYLTNNSIFLCLVSWKDLLDLKDIDRLHPEL